MRRISTLRITGRELEIVQSHKVLGLTIQNNLKCMGQTHSILNRESFQTLAHSQKTLVRHSL